MHGAGSRSVLSATVAVAAFALYHATLVPGVDFGDTGSFQTAVSTSLITPRDGYPLYFALGKIAVRIARTEPARALNLASALAGALPYAWNVHTMWQLPNPPDGLGEALQRFWFDVTKTDWRETMVMSVPRSLLNDRAAMYWFDLREQFGIAGPLLGGAGL